MLALRVIVNLSGVVLVTAGIWLTVVQFERAYEQPEVTHRSRSARVEGPGNTKVSMTTTYPGLIMVGCGAVLLVSSIVSRRANRGEGNSA